MSAGTFNELKGSTKLRPTKVRLFDFANRNLINQLGVATLKVRHKDRQHQLDFFVIPGSGPTLLSCSTCSKLNLLRRVDLSSQLRSVSSTENLLLEFDDVFNNIGCLSGEHHIAADPTIKPVIHALRKVPLAIQPKLKQLLDRHEKKASSENAMNRPNG